MEGLSNKEKRHMDMDNSVVMARGEGIRGVNGNGKKTIKSKYIYIYIYICI